MLARWTSGQTSTLLEALFSGVLRDGFPFRPKGTSFNRLLLAKRNHRHRFVLGDRKFRRIGCHRDPNDGDLSPDDRYATPQEVMQALLPFLKPEMRDGIIPPIGAFHCPDRKGRSNQRKHQILIVDDEPEMRLFCRYAWKPRMDLNVTKLPTGC